MYVYFLNYENFFININNECMLLELCFIKLNLNRINVYYFLNFFIKFFKEWELVVVFFLVYIIDKR